MVYIWVPVTSEELKNAKVELRKLYENYKDANGEKLSFSTDSELYEVFYGTSEQLPEELIKSVDEYGGFYISEAELSYTSEGKDYNKGRAMTDNTVTKTAEGGDYYRNKLKYSEIIEKAKQIDKDNKAVNSHLIYGAQWDATMLWIIKTNSEYTDTKGNNITNILIKDSTNCGKYKNSNLSSTSTVNESSIFFNGIWGLGGNLSEITQERYMQNEEYVLRGGSYATTGEGAPIAGRKLSGSEIGESIGFRTCLYLTPGLLRIKEKADEKNTIDKIYEEAKALWDKEKYEEAYKIIEPYAEYNDMRIQFMFGWCYYYGYGVEQNYETAVKWYAKSAEQGYARGQYCLGWSYYNGKGVKKDINEAKKWLEKAANQGYENAKKFLKENY